jgi:hypothetical protein
MTTKPNLLPPGLYADFRVESALPVLRRYSKRGGLTLNNEDQTMQTEAMLNFADLADATLSALADDPAVPAELADAAKAEIERRDGGAEGNGGNALTKDSDKRAAAAKRSSDGKSAALNMTPGNGGIAASHGKGGNPLLRNAEERVRRAAQ